MNLTLAQMVHAPTLARLEVRDWNELTDLGRPKWYVLPARPSARAVAYHLHDDKLRRLTTHHRPLETLDELALEPLAREVLGLVVGLYHRWLEGNDTGCVRVPEESARRWRNEEWHGKALHRAALAEWLRLTGSVMEVASDQRFV